MRLIRVQLVRTCLSRCYTSLFAQRPLVGDGWMTVVVVGVDGAAVTAKPPKTPNFSPLVGLFVREGVP